MFCKILGCIITVFMFCTISWLLSHDIQKLSYSTSAMQLPSFFKEYKKDQTIYLDYEDYLQKNFNIKPDEVFIDSRKIGSGSEKTVFALYLYNRTTGEYLGCLKMARIKLTKFSILIDEIIKKDGQEPSVGLQTLYILKDTKKIIDKIQRQIDAYMINDIFIDDHIIPYYFVEFDKNYPFEIQIFGKFVPGNKKFNAWHPNLRAGWVWYSTFIFFQDVFIDKKNNIHGYGFDINYGNTLYNPYHKNNTDVFTLVDLPVGNIGQFSHFPLKKLFDILQYSDVFFSIPNINIEDYLDSYDDGTSNIRRDIRLNPNNPILIWSMIDSMLHAVKKYTSDGLIKILLLIHKDSRLYFKSDYFNDRFLLALNLYIVGYTHNILKDDILYKAGMMLHCA